VSIGGPVAGFRGLCSLDGSSRKIHVDPDLAIETSIFEPDSKTDAAVEAGWSTEVEEADHCAADGYLDGG
jgi:hypothetical protein